MIVGAGTDDGGGVAGGRKEAAPGCGGQVLSRAGQRSPMWVRVAYLDDG